MRWIAATGLVLILAALVCVPVAGAEPLPDYQKILQIHLAYDDSGYSVSGTEVRYGEAPNLNIRSGELEGAILDADGNELKSFPLRDPGIAYGDIAGSEVGDSIIGYTETSAAGEMMITVPYLAGMQQFRMSDSRDGTLLVSTGLNPPVTEFCTAYPGDPDCLARLPVSRSTVPDQGTRLLLATLLSASIFMAAGLAIWTIRRRADVQGFRKQVVLIVDDDPDIVEAIAELLRMEDYATIAASSGRECLDLIRKEIPDLVLLDVGMSPMDGWQTLAQIKKGPASRKIPVLMLTGRRLTTEAAKQYHICIDDYLMKPFQPDELYAAINSILEREHTLKETLALARQAGVDKEKFCELAKLSRRITVDKKLLGILNVPMAVPAVADLDLDTLDDMLVVDYINVKTRDQEKRAAQLRQEINSVLRSKGLPELGW